MNKTLKEKNLSCFRKNRMYYNKMKFKTKKGEVKNLILKLSAN